VLDQHKGDGADQTEQEHPQHDRRPEATPWALDEPVWSLQRARPCRRRSEDIDGAFGFRSNDSGHAGPTVPARAPREAQLMKKIPAPRRRRDQVTARSGPAAEARPRGRTRRRWPGLGRIRRRGLQDREAARGEQGRPDPWTTRATMRALRCGRVRMRPKRW